MAVKYLQRAATGAAVDPNAIDLNSLLQQQNQQQQFTNSNNLVQLLAQLDAQGRPAAVSPLDVMSANNQQAAQQAQGYNPSATYLTGYSPGGLYDYLSNFMGQLGYGPGPTLDNGDRLVNHVAAPSMADAVTQAQNINSQMGSGAGGGKYDSVIQAILAPLIQSIMGNTSTDTSGASTPANNGPTGFDTKPGNTGVGLPGGASANVPSPAEQLALAQQNANNQLNGGGLNSILSLLANGGSGVLSNLGQALNPNGLVRGLSNIHPGY